MKKELTLKQSLFIKSYFDNGGNKVQAALAVYDTNNYKSASKIADENFKNPLIRHKIQSLISKNKINFDLIAEKISEGLGAKKFILNSATSKIIETNLPDYDTRHKYIALLLEIWGLKKLEKEKDKSTPVLVSAEKLKEIKHRLRS